MIPPAFPEPLKAEDLVDIKSLDEFAQTAFAGVKRLNPVQSKCFNCAYKSNENMVLRAPLPLHSVLTLCALQLVCAPTGAGKTNIALLTVLHEIEQHIEHG